MNKEDLLTTDEFEEAVVLAVEEGRTTFMIFEDKDGNYRGLKRIGNVVVQSREGDPNTVLTSLITTSV